jgi:hypothetical protein
VSGVPIITQSRYCFLSAVQDGSSRVFTRDRRLWSPDTRNKPNSEGIMVGKQTVVLRCSIPRYSVSSVHT